MKSARAARVNPAAAASIQAAEAVASTRADLAAADLAAADLAAADLAAADPEELVAAIADSIR